MSGNVNRQELIAEIARLSGFANPELNRVTLNPDYYELMDAETLTKIASDLRQSAALKTAIVGGSEASPVADGEEAIDYGAIMDKVAANVPAVRGTGRGPTDKLKS